MLEKLPDRWCINRKDNQIIIDWFLSKVKPNIKSFHEEMAGYLTHFPYYQGNYTSFEYWPGYTEISFSDFERLVLNKQPIKEDYSFLIKILKKYNIR